MTVARLEEPTPAVALHGVVAEGPKAHGDPFTVTVPGFDEEHVFEIRRYESRGTNLPAAGDEVLVIFDDVSEPWVPAWWAADSATEVEFVQGPEGAEDGALAAFDGPSGKLIKQAGPITSEMIEAVEASKITGQITETQIGPEAVTTPKLAAGSVTAGKIVAGTITAVQIAAGTITASQIAAGTITATNIATGTITATQIAAGTIKGTNIEAGTITGSLIAAGTIEAGNLKANTITAGQIAAGTITATQIASHTITATQITAGTITSTEIAATTITAANIAAGTITGKEIAAVTITAANIAAGTIVGGNIASGTITAGLITIASLSALSADLGTITAGTVTGATLRTAATGSRVVIDSEGLHAFNATEGVLDFNIGTGNLTLKGEVKAGSTVPASTVTGELTAAQIKEITAAKVSGKLTNAQIESIEAAKLTGTITETQIGKEAISTAKIQANAITSAQIAANTIVAADIAAETITAAQIAAATITTSQIAANTIVAGNIAAGTITTTEIKAATIKGTNIAAETIETGNLKAEAITAAKIAALTITGSQIAAGTIAAGKLTVSELSAITANLGTITAGTIKGGTIESSTGGTVMNASGFHLLAGESTTPPADRIVNWVNPAKTTFITGAVRNYFVAKDSFIQITAEDEEKGFCSIQIDTAEGGRVWALAGAQKAEILNGEGQSAFLQLKGGLSGEPEKRKINFGVSKLKFPASPNATPLKVAHGLGATPKVVVASVRENAGTSTIVTNTGNYTSGEFTLYARYIPGTNISNELEVDWIAIG